MSFIKYLEEHPCEIQTPGVTVSRFYCPIHTEHHLLHDDYTGGYWCDYCCEFYSPRTKKIVRFNPITLEKELDE
jgi:hypothetical protein